MPTRQPPRIARTGRNRARRRWVVRGSRAAAVAASERVRTYGLTLALLALLFAASLRGQSAGLDLSFHAFQDSRGVLVWTPDLTIEHAASDRTVLRARFGVDVI